MGRSENQRIRGDLSRAAENALWDVVEDLENLKQNVLRTLQDDVRRLEAEKNRLANDIQRLIEEKDKLQQSRQISEQQVLIRQLAEVLAKHISSQLQSSLKTLANQTNTGEFVDSQALKSAEVNSTVASKINQNVEQMLNNLDDTVTIAFSSLQQELKNYQGNLSQQLLRMYDQQQQGEEILAAFINRLQEELKQTTDTNYVKDLTKGAPTILQLNEPHKNGSLAKSPEKIAAESIALLTQELPITEVSSTESVVTLSPTTEKPPEPISVIVPESTPVALKPDSSTLEKPPEPISVIVPESTPAALKPDSSTLEKPAEPISVIVPESTPAALKPDSSTSEKPPEPISVIVPESTSAALKPDSSTSEKPPEPISVIVPESTPAALKPDSSTSEKPPEPISVIVPESTSATSTSYPRPILPKQEITPPKQRSQNSPKWSSVQIGFLLVVLSTVMSSLYNVAIKALFYQTQQFIPPTVGNIFFILMLRLLVVVPLMLLLAPILHPPVWQELQNFFNSLSKNAASGRQKTKQVLLLSIISGGFLFLSQVLIYLAISKITTGVAIALFFIYPMITGLLAWLLFRERPNLFSATAISSIFGGQLLILGSYSIFTNNTSFGIISGITSGIAFAIYVILTRLCAPKLHPVAFALINFITMLLLSLICLLVSLPSSDWGVDLKSSEFLEVILSGFMLGFLTLCGYLFNNFGIRKLGGQRSAIIGAVVPVLTVIFAGLMIQEKLDILQILGVLLVTGGTVGVSFAKMQNQVKSSSSKN